MKKLIEKIGFFLFSVNIWVKVKDYSQEDLIRAALLIDGKIKELKEDDSTPSYLRIIRITDKNNRACFKIGNLEKGNSLDDPKNFSNIYADYSIMRNGHGPLYIFRMGKNFCTLEMGNNVPPEDMKKFEGILPFCYQSADYQNLILLHFFKKINEVKAIVCKIIQENQMRLLEEEEKIKQKLLKEE